MDDKDKLSIRDAYLCLFRLYADAEMITWTRFNNFLLFNSILILSWATLWVSKSGGGVPRGIYVVIGVLGFLSGLIWGALGHRGRKMQYKFGDVAEEIEGDPKVWVPAAREAPYWDQVFKYGPVTKSKKFADEVRFRSIASKTILSWGPVAVGLLHLVLMGYGLGWLG